jgi:hypothetical protein
MDRGLLKYFPKALAAVATLSMESNEQHNPGEPMHWAREKSNDHGDCIVRHQADSGTIDNDGQRHSTKVAWRALAQLELELEAAESKTDPRDESEKAFDAAYFPPSSKPVEFDAYTRQYHGIPPVPDDHGTEDQKL